MDSNLDINKLKAIVDQHNNLPKIPCGLVFREGLREYVLNSLPIAESKNELPMPSALFNGIPFYFDSTQKEDCIVFEDVDLMRAYINRHDDMETWARELVKHLPNQIRFDDFKSIPPTIPVESPVSRWVWY